MASNSLHPCHGGRCSTPITSPNASGPGLPGNSTPHDIHAPILEALAGVEAVAALSGEFDNDTIPLTGWQLACLLQPIAERLAGVLAVLLARSGNEVSPDNGG